MRTVLTCPVKINITLRILNRRDDGYHELISAFWRKNGAERLTIYPLSNDNTGDKLEVSGAEISGENILTKTMRLAADTCTSIPPLHMTLDKVYPAGSGIGAGSGNAAALVAFLSEKYGAFGNPADVAKLGADVAFLASSRETALAAGIGEKLTQTSSLDGLCWVIAFPTWTSGTAAAYSALDEARRTKPRELPCADKCRQEALDIIAALGRKQQCGLLPNDFLEVARAEHGEYDMAFNAAAGTSLAWGLCGSGSAFFAICGDIESAKETAREFTRNNWIIKTAIME